MRHTLILLTLALVSPLPAAAQDWTRFRGPGGAGHGQGARIPIEFEASDARWRVELPGKGHSSPVILGERLIVTSEDADRQVRFVLCLSTQDGRTLWTFESDFEAHGQHQLNSFSSATPTVDEDGVYVLWTTGGRLEALALDLEGQPLWRRDLGPSKSQHGGGISPVLHGDVLLVGNDNEDEASWLAGLDRRTGKTLWKRDRESTIASYATPLVLADEGTQPQAIFASTAHGITSLNPRTGELLWEFDAGFEARCVGLPVRIDDLLFVSAGTGGGGKQSVVIRMPAEKGAEPELAYAPRRALPYVPTAIAVDDLLFLWSDGGIVSCVRAEDGEELWRERLDGRFFGSPILLDGRLYAMSMSGELAVLAAGPEFEELARIDLGEPSQATPAVAHGTLFLRTERHLLAIGGQE